MTGADRTGPDQTEPDLTGPDRTGPDVGIVVVNYGSHDLVEGNLSGLPLADLRAEVFVVDNLRSAGDTEAVAEVCARHGWHLHRMDANPGFGTAVNAGAEAAFARGCRTVLVVNPDLAVSADVVAALTAATLADPRAAVAPRIVRPDGSTWFGGAFISLDGGRTRSVPGPPGPRTPPWLSGACLAVHRELWREVGGFDGDYFMYWEDVDLGFRLWRAGAHLVVRDDLVAVHDVGGTQHDGPSRAKSSLYYYYNCRNRLLFAGKHLDRRDRRRWLLATPADVRRVVLRGGRRQLATPQRNLWPAVRGAVAGALAVLRPAR